MANNPDILSRLDVPALCRELVPSLKPVGKDGKQALGTCPFHEDKGPSLSVRLTDGAFNCKSCGKRGTWVLGLLQEVRGISFQEALNELERRAGLPVSSIKAPTSKLTGRYEYFDQNGTLAYCKERREVRGGKTFSFTHKDENGNRKTGKPDSKPSLLYRLPEVLLANTVYFVEGEAHADLLHGWGLTATTLDCGASTKLTPEQIHQLTGKNIFIFPDNDEPGRKYADHIATTMQGKAQSIKVLSLPGLPEKGDILDWEKTPGNDKTKLICLVEEAPDWEPTEVNIGTRKDTAIITDADKQRTFPSCYVPTARLFNDPLRGYLKLGQGPLYDSLVLRIAHAPGAHLPNNPDGISRSLETDADKRGGPHQKSAGTWSPCAGFRRILDQSNDYGMVHTKQ